MCFFNVFKRAGTTVSLIADNFQNSVTFNNSIYNPLGLTLISISLGNTRQPICANSNPVSGRILFHYLQI